MQQLCCTLSLHLPAHSHPGVASAVDSTPAPPTAALRLQASDSLRQGGRGGGRAESLYKCQRAASKSTSTSELRLIVVGSGAVQPWDYPAGSCLWESSRQSACPRLYSIVSQSGGAAAKFELRCGTSPCPLHKLRHLCSQHYTACTACTAHLTARCRSELRCDTTSCQLQRPPEPRCRGSAAALRAARWPARRSAAARCRRAPKRVGVGAAGSEAQSCADQGTESYCQQRGAGPLRVSSVLPPAAYELPLPQPSQAPQPYGPPPHLN